MSFAVSVAWLAAGLSLTPRAHAALTPAEFIARYATVLDEERLWR